MFRALRPWLRLYAAFALRWLALSLAGWTAYVVVLAFVTTVALGAPWYDAQWYVPVSVLLVALPVHLAWRWPHTRATTLAYTVLLAWVAIGMQGFGHVEQLDVAGAPPIALSFWAYTDFLGMPDSVLQDLGDAHATIYLHSPAKTFDGAPAQRLAAGLRRMAGYGIEVVLSPPVSDFLSAPVEREWSANALAAAAFVRREGLTNVRGVIGDAEVPMHPPPAPAGGEQAEYDQAARGLGELIDTLHRDNPGLQVGVTGLWAHYVDGLDGDTDMARAMRSPLDPPGSWDFVNLMTYTSAFAPEDRAYTVYSLERAMARRYPQGRISHLIGLVGGGFPGEPVIGFEDLVRDARISRALGVREIVVFQLNGALTVFGDDFVRRFRTAVNGPQAEPSVAVPFSRRAAGQTYGVAAADALLDGAKRARWAWLGWALACAVVARRSVGVSAPPR